MFLAPPLDRDLCPCSQMDVLEVATVQQLQKVLTDLLTVTDI